MKNKFLLLIISIITLLSACDFYPDWHKYVEYSSVYPVCGEYMVKDYEMNSDSIITETYHFYIYNRAYNPTGDSIWLDNRAGHPATTTVKYPFKFKVKAKADTVNLTFDVQNAGDIVGSNLFPLDSATRVTIKNSRIWDMSDDITDPTPDSIYFEVEYSYYLESGNDTTIYYYTAGHRKTGWEEPNYDDPMN
jgi:hypothetical protein